MIWARICHYCKFCFAEEKISKFETLTKNETFSTKNRVLTLCTGNTDFVGIHWFPPDTVI